MIFSHIFKVGNLSLCDGQIDRANMQNRCNAALKARGDPTKH